MIFFFIYMMVYFSLQKKHLHVFTYYISKSQHEESASVLHTNRKKKKKKWILIKILKDVALCMNSIQI